MAQVAEPYSSASIQPVANKGEIVYGDGVRRLCKLPSCGIEIKPKGPGATVGLFCCIEHKNQYWRLAAEIGDRTLTSLAVAKCGKSHSEQVLAVLRRCAPAWVDRPMQRLPYVLWGTTISKLRKRGFDIRCRRVWREDVMRNEYQYKLVTK